MKVQMAVRLGMAIAASFAAAADCRCPGARVIRVDPGLAVIVRRWSGRCDRTANSAAGGTIRRSLKSSSSPMISARQWTTIFQNHREKLVDLRANVEKAEIAMEPLVRADQPNESAVMAQIDKVAQARAELEKANARFLFALRAKLTPEQWKQVQDFRQNHEDMRHEWRRGDRRERAMVRARETIKALRRLLLLRDPRACWMKAPVLMRIFSPAANQ